MGFLKRVFGGDPAPDWTPFSTGEEYRAFVEVVESDLTRRGTPFQMGDGMVLVDFGDGEPHQCGLSNLAQVCRLASRDEWAEVVKLHFDNLATTVDVADMTLPFEEAKQLLKVKVHAAGDYGDDVREMLLWAPIAPGLIKVLVFDLPTMVRTVNPEARASWGVADDELFAIGEANLDADTPAPETQSFEAAPGVLVQALVGDSHFVGSRILRYHLLAPASPSHGAVVAIPNRHVLLHHHIADLGAVVAVQSMVQVAHNFYVEGPGSLFQGLLWWHDGALTVLPSTVTKKGVEFYPPDAFVELLNRLPPPSVDTQR